MNVEGYCDGSSLIKGKGGSPSGWGYIFWYNLDEETKMEWTNYGSYKLSTIGRMEVMAMLELLKALPQETTYASLHSDSRYVINSIVKEASGEEIKSTILTGWVQGWQDRPEGSWTKPICHIDLWKDIVATIKLLVGRGCMLKFAWVAAHKGNYGNEWANTLANQGSREAKLL